MPISTRSSVVVVTHIPLVDIKKERCLVKAIGNREKVSLDAVFNLPPV